MMFKLRRALGKRARRAAARRNLNRAVNDWIRGVAEARAELDSAQREASRAASQVVLAESHFQSEVRGCSIEVASNLEDWLQAFAPLGGWWWGVAGDVVVGHASTSIEPGGQSITVGIEPTDDGGFRWFAASVRWRTVRGTGESLREALDAMRRSLTEPVAYDDAWPDLAPLVEKLQAAVETLTVSSVDVGDASPASDTAARRRPRGPGGRFAPRDPAAPDGGGP